VIPTLLKIGKVPDEELSDDGQVINNKKSGERYAATSRHKSFFTTDNKQFIDNIVDILEGILDDYDVPQDYNSLYEQVNEAGWNFNDSALDTASINRTIERAIEDSLDLLGDDDGSSMGDEDTAKLKTQVIQTFNKILKSLGQDPTSSVIENEIVTMEFDRSRFQMDYKVYTKMTNKETNKKEEGYMNIKDIPTYFTNYKLFEQLRLMKKLIKR
jgi:regulator of replication initiation timing